MRAGHADEEKKAFYHKVWRISRATRALIRHVIIIIAENQDIDWSFRDGNAQFVT